MRTLNKLEQGRIMCDHDPTDLDIFNALVNLPDAAFLTVSHAAANRVNTVTIVNLFRDQEPLGSIDYDNENGQKPLYLNMKVMITQNRDKENGVVNGCQAKVIAMHNISVFFQLENNRVVAICPIMDKVDGLSFNYL